MPLATNKRSDHEPLGRPLGARPRHQGRRSSAAPWYAERVTDGWNAVALRPIGDGAPLTARRRARLVEVAVEDVGAALHERGPGVLTGVVLIRPLITSATTNAGLASLLHLHGPRVAARQRALGTRVFVGVGAAAAEIG